jgi:two-component system NtrC family sensor kinase
VTDLGYGDARILIVDDDPAGAYLMERHLRSAGYTSVRGLTDSRQALAVHDEWHPDLILLDLWMPPPNGFEVLEQLQQVIAADDFVPVVMLTGDDTDQAVRRALDLGATDFVRKTFDEREMLLRIRNLLRTRRLHVAMRERNEVLEARVQERARQLVQMEKLSAMGQLLAGVAHELNNPLAVDSGQAQLLRRATSGSPVADRAEMITRAADRCVRVVRNFLALAREQPPERTHVDVNGVIRGAIELLEYELRTDGVEVELDLDPGVPVLWADPHQLHQVLVNLIANAHHAMRRMGAGARRLRARAGPADGGVRIEISDSGPGIPAEIQHRIFEPFFTTKAPGQGTGLGLSLSHGIVHDHGGTLRVESQPGQGATFIIDLPAASAQAAVAAAVEPAALPPIAPARILVVDDEDDVAAVLVDMLRAEGHQVDTARDGREALERIDAGRYDLVLSDTKMPRLDGPGLFAELERRHPRLRRRIAFLTGDVLNQEKRAFLEASGAPSVAKPFGLEDVQRVVRALLAGPAPA